MRAHGANRYAEGPDETGQPGKGCRCKICRAAKTRQQKVRRLAMERGTHRPMVDAAPVREHVARLRAAGLDYAWIARAAGVSDRVVDALLYDAPSGWPTRKLRPENADALLGVSVELAREKMRAAVGVQRRLRGLALLGWSAGALAERVGIHRDHVVRLQNADPVMTVSPSTVARVTEACSRSWQANPVAAGITPSRVALVRRIAAGKGWAPLLAFDDIDDPDEIPDVGAQSDRALALLENSDWLIAQGYTIERAAERMGLSASTLGATRLRTKAKLAAPPGPKKKITRNRVPKKALHLLSESERLRAEGLSIPAVAAEFGISEGYLKRARALALRHLEGAS